MPPTAASIRSVLPDRETRPSLTATVFVAPSAVVRLPSEFIPTVVLSFTDWSRSTSASFTRLVLDVLRSMVREPSSATNTVVSSTRPATTFFTDSRSPELSLSFKVILPSLSRAKEVPTDVPSLISVIFWFVSLSAWICAFNPSGVALPPFAIKLRAVVELIPASTALLYNTELCFVRSPFDSNVPDIFVTNELTLSISFSVRLPIFFFNSSGTYTEKANSFWYLLKELWILPFLSGFASFSTSNTSDIFTVVTLPVLISNGPITISLLLSLIEAWLFSVLSWK